MTGEGSPGALSRGGRAPSHEVPRELRLRTAGQPAHHGLLLTDHPGRLRSGCVWVGDPAEALSWVHVAPSTVITVGSGLNLQLTHLPSAIGQGS